MQQQLKHAPQIETLCQEARERLHSDQIEEATELLEQALEIDRENPTALSLHGVCLAQKGTDFQRAIDHCRRALRMKPRVVEYQVNMGRVYRLQGDRSAAYDVFFKSWRLNREHAAPASELARMGVRKKPVLPFLSRSNWCNRRLGILRERLRRTWESTRQKARSLA